MRAINLSHDDTAVAVEARRVVSVLGSTGSVGCNTVDLLRENSDRFTIDTLTANSNASLLAEQAKMLGARLAVVGDESSYAELRDLLSGSGIETAAGGDALIEAAARPVDLFMASIVGAAGLKPTMTALEHARTVALANKECLVCAGSIFMDRAERFGTRILPVDSEHSAIFQALGEGDRDGLEQIVLTASGGPFRTWALQDMKAATITEALRHPNWTMGAKITIDSATMMNKGLELIEAHHLFGLPGARIDILVHPESIIHGMATYTDGSVIAHMGAPDMRTPIAVAMGWPDRMKTTVQRLNLAELGKLTFEAPDEVRFPGIRLARYALDAGNGAATMMNAANEVAVAAFLAEEIGFMDISAIVEETLEVGSTDFDVPGGDLDAVVVLDHKARVMARELVGTRAI